MDGMVVRKPEIEEDAGDERSTLIVPGAEGFDRATTPTEETEGTEEEGLHSWLTLQSNVYSASIAGVIRDIAVTKVGETWPKKVARVAVSATVIVLAIFLQTFLVIKVRTLVCAQSVHFIREMYGDFEEHMYTTTYLTVNGYMRGKLDAFRPEVFADLDEAFKEDVCQIPLSQPDFLGVVLFIWTLTVLSEVRKCIMWMYRFIWVSPTVTATKDMTKVADDTDGVGKQKIILVKGVVWWVKVMVGILLSIQSATALYLLWVGCRWLVATPRFSDLVLNGLALSFIVLIKEMLYDQLLPRLFQDETESIRILGEKVWLRWRTIVTPICLFAMSATWVWVYMVYLQRVLPDYQWDVKNTCYEFLLELTDV